MPLVSAQTTRGRGLGCLFASAFMLQNGGSTSIATYETPTAAAGTRWSRSTIGWRRNTPFLPDSMIASR